MTEITWGDLTEAEREALKALPLPNRLNANSVESLAVIRQYGVALLFLQDQGLVDGVSTPYYFVTPLGRTVLAQAAVADARPTVISAEQFANEDYPAKIKARVCNVHDSKDRPLQYRFKDEWGCYCFGISETADAAWLYYPTDELTVEWLTTPAAATAQTEADAAGNTTIVCAETHPEKNSVEYWKQQYDIEAYKAFRLEKALKQTVDETYLNKVEGWLEVLRKAVETAYIDTFVLSWINVPHELAPKMMQSEIEKLRAQLATLTAERDAAGKALAIAEAGLKDIRNGVQDNRGNCQDCDTVATVATATLNALEPKDTP